MVPFVVVYPEPLTAESRGMIRDYIDDAMRNRKPLVLDSGAVIHRLDSSRVTSSFLRRARAKHR